VRGRCFTVAAGDDRLANVSSPAFEKLWMAGHGLDEVQRDDPSERPRIGNLEAAQTPVRRSLREAQRARVGDHPPRVTLLAR